MLFLICDSKAQDVTTWHNDNNRTGWQQSETILTPTSVQSGFGKVFQYSTSGEVYAQPLVVSSVSATNCHPAFPCDVVYVATEKDMLYGFDATSSTQFWSTDLAAAAGGTYLDCTPTPPPLPCSGNHTVLYPEIGVTGTPVIDATAHILYVVTMVVAGAPPSPQYYIHAVDIATGSEKPYSPQLISASVAGLAPSDVCLSSAGSGTVTFDPAEHLQRAGLLLLNGAVYVAFAPADGEVANGWILGYQYNAASGFSLVATFNSTSYGTGGGIWQSRAGLAAGTAVVGGQSSTYIFVATGNGTFDANTAGGVDYGDSLLRLNPADLTVTDYFTPGDVFSTSARGYVRRTGTMAPVARCCYPIPLFLAITTRSSMRTKSRKSTS